MQGNHYTALHHRAFRSASRRVHYTFVDLSAQLTTRSKGRFRKDNLVKCQSGRKSAILSLACEQAHLGAQARAEQPRARNRVAKTPDEIPSLRIALLFGARARLKGYMLPRKGTNGDGIIIVFPLFDSDV